MRRPGIDATWKPFLGAVMLLEAGLRLSYVERKFYRFDEVLPRSTSRRDEHRHATRELYTGGIVGADDVRRHQWLRPGSDVLDVVKTLPYGRRLASSTVAPLAVGACRAETRWRRLLALPPWGDEVFAYRPSPRLVEGLAPHGELRPACRGDETECPLHRLHVE